MRLEDLGVHGNGARAVDGEVHEGPGVAAVVHPVVDQPRVLLRRDPLAGGVEVGLVGHRVLEVAEVVALVGQQLEERDAEVGRVALEPGRVQLRDQVEQQPAEARVVLGQVVDERLDRALRRTDLHAGGNRSRPDTRP